MSEQFTIDDRNKVKRAPQRGHYDKETLYKILDDGFLCHVGFTVNGQPFVIPTLYGREGDAIYIHGATTSRLIKNLEKGVDVCLTITHVDGIVLARSAFHHSMNYRSATVFGRAQIVSEEQKNRTLFIISENILKGRWDDSRKPNEKELKATTVLGIHIEQASSKIRTGPPKDDPEDYALNIWAGVLPIQQSLGELIPDPELGNHIKPSDNLIKATKG